MLRARVRAAVVAALIGSLPCVAAGRPGIDEAAKKVEALVREASSASPARRGELVEESIKARQELIALGANDNRLATWLLDQAEAVLQNAGRDGAELSALYGAPTSAQRARLREASAEASKVHEQAMKAVEEAVARLEAELFAARGDAARVKAASAKVEPQMRVLVDVEQSWRLPMLEARAALVNAACLEDQKTPVPLRNAGAGCVAVLQGIRGPNQAAETARRLLLATAMTFAGGRLDAMHEFAEIEPGADGIAAEQARLGLARSAADLIGAREAARLVERGSADAPISLDLLRSEVIARAVLRNAPDDDARLGVQREGLDGMARVVERMLEAGADAAFQEMVAEKVAILTADVPVEKLQPSIMYARGVFELVRGTPGARPHGVALLSRVADGDGSEVIRASALWQRGTFDGAERDPDRAAAALLRLAKEFPTAPRAGESLDRAEALLRGPAAKHAPVAVAMHREVVELILSREPSPRPERANELRSLYLASYAATKADPLDASSLDRTLSMAPAWPDERADRRATDERHAWMVIERSFAAAKENERERTAQIGAEWAIKHAPAIAPHARLIWAAALVDSGDAKKSLEQIEAIGVFEKSPLSDAERRRARLILGRAQRATGDEAAAFATLRSLADDLDHEPAPTAVPPAGSTVPRRAAEFWASWTEMLEILQSENANNERTPTIRLQLNRLKLIDAQLGGEPWKTRIGKVEESLK